ncbi:hypothetical protein P7J53_05385, partial [Streptococcus suis]|uniref:hypothetical protein n=1 Tax=Streptococcus suis TaxID=1307 RepID=UPI0038BD23BE
TEESTDVYDAEACSPCLNTKKHHFFTQRLGRVQFLSRYKCVHKITGDGQLTPRHQTKLPMGNFYILY